MKIEKNFGLFLPDSLVFVLYSGFDHNLTKNTVLGVECKQGAEKITRILDRAQKIMDSESKTPIEVGEKYLQEYGPYQ